ncbi:MAG: ATPase [Rhodobacter sp.]|nr:ATPase [Rhodobacter sp.]
MSDWKIRRFWSSATVAPSEAGYAVLLDTRPVRTPAKAALAVPTVQMAQAIAAEWDAQTGTVNPEKMPVTRGANAAIDKVAQQRGEVVAMLAGYGDSDLTCYRAAQPQELVARQAEAWDPLLDWAHATYGARLHAVQGVMHKPQSPQHLARLTAPLETMTAFELVAMHDLISLSGSLVIGLAASVAAMPVDVLWDRSRIDEDWQAEQWGVDDEAAAQAMQKSAAFRNAARFLALARGQASSS